MYRYLLIAGMMLVFIGCKDSTSPTTTESVPAVPALSLPANGAADQAVATTLTWGTVSDASSYGVQVSTASDFSTITASQSGLTGTQYAPAGLSNRTTYYWRANAKNGAGTSDWATAWSFTTIAAVPTVPTAPTLGAPSNGASDQATELTLTWNAVSNASSYAVQVSTAADFSTTSAAQDGLTGAQFSPAGLNGGATYFWRVNAQNGVGTGVWSTAWSFTTISDPIPAAPAGGAKIYAEGFGGDLSAYQDKFMLAADSFYTRMSITSAVAHSGVHSLTTDSNRNALCYEVNPRPESGKVGIQFYIMASAAGSINFTVEMGQNAGSSGGLSKSFGFGFDQTNVVKAVYHDVNYGMFGQADTMLGAIVPGRWYKCRVEANLDDMSSNSSVVFYLDDIEVYHMPLPTIEMYGIDRILVFRGYGDEGAKPYYVDDIVLYKK